MAENTTTYPLKPFQHQNPKKPHSIQDSFMRENLQKRRIKINFPGWRKPHQSWTYWVEKLSIKHAKIWELTGICDGILSSLHEIKPNPEIILGLSEFWCSKTNSFIFPWGEATITLEDVYILSGLPVIGENVNFSLFDDSSKNLVQKLQQVKNALSTTITTETNAWIKYFSKENDDVEHVGFLAFWLSMFVFPDLDERSVGNHGFSVAINLSKGVKIALAPAVLACLYQNMTFLAQSVAGCDYVKEVSVAGPFQILQVWALERFPLLGSKLAKPLCLGQPRIARWDKVSVKVSMVDVRKILRSSRESFCWRPYASRLENWRKKAFYDVDDGGGLKFLSDFSGDVDDELISFRLFMQPGELIGIEYTEKYQPQRVMLQFRCDEKGSGVAGSSSPLQTGNASLLKVEKSFAETDNQLSKESLNAQINANVESRKQEGDDDDDDDRFKPCYNKIDEGLDHEGNDDVYKKPMLVNHITEMLLNCDKGNDISKLEVDDSPKSVLLNASGDENCTKHNNCINNEGQVSEGNVDTHKKPKISNEAIVEGDCDEVTNLPHATQSEVMNDNENGTAKDCGKDVDRCLEGLVVLDSEDEMVENHPGFKYASELRRTRMKLKRKRIGDSPDYPLLISECSSKVVRTAKNNGNSIWKPIDVEDYWL